MSTSDELLTILGQQREEYRLQQLLENKGYSNPKDDDFGLNQWTCRLTPRHSRSEEEKQESVIQLPDHFVSFLAIPAIWGEDLIDTDSAELHGWLSEHKWHPIPGMQSPFLQAIIQACNGGLLLPQWVQTSLEGWLKVFLLIGRDGVVEFGLGRDAYNDYEGDTIFQLIHIVGRLSQFLTCVNDLYEKFFPNFPEETFFIVNMRGTKGALMGNLAEGWYQPIPGSFNSYLPRCADKHLQIKRKIASSMSANDIEEIVRWFATRIENAWGQFEPRCYVHQNIDESRPFARRKSN